MEKYDISQLTEFPRFEQETNQGGVSTFLNKLWKLPLFSPTESVNLQNKAISDGKQQRHVADDQNKQDIDDIKTETGSYAVEYEGRSLPNILQRISSLTALGSSGGTKYADTELARYWMPDDISRECYECAARFSTLRRRHHCRVCGQIFCSRCCSQRVPGQIFGCAGGLRVCNYCCNIVLSYLRENDMTGEIADLRTLQENLQVKFPDNKSEQISNKSKDNFMFASEQDERCELRSSPKEALQDVFRQLSFSLPTQQHRYRLVRYNGVWRGADVLQWIMENTNNKTRVQASAVCQSFVSAGYMECTSELTQFADYALYRPLASTQHEHEQPEECDRLVESVSSYCLDLNLDDSSARLIKAPKTDVKSSPSSEEEINHPILEQSEVNPEAEASDNKVCRAISSSGCEHLRLLLRQCLAREALPPAWLSVLYPLCQQAADIIMPDIYGNDIDVRNYVQVKKVAGGSMRDGHVIHGVVMTKNVAHRGMPQQISNPTILLLDCSIAYQRVEGKLTSLEPVLLQEREYLVRCAARITALRPHVVLVRGSAARGVQDALRREGVALAVGARERALARAARCTGADRVTSVDARIHAPTLGTAHRFAVNNYSGKTLMILEGCANPHLGCCILLRGAPLPELAKVKKVVKFMLLAFYNWKVEKAFLGDIEAVLPEPGMEFDDDETNQTEKDDSIEPKKDDSDTKLDDDESKDGNSDIKSNNNELGNNIDRSNDNKEFDSQRKNDLFYDPTTDANEKFKENMATKMNEPFSDALSNPKSDKNLDEANKIKHTNDDTTQKTKLFVRKADSDKNLSCGVPIRDFSDPLRSTLSVDDDVFLPKDEAVLKADSQNDRWSTDDVVLSMSPNVVIPAPFLETEVGRKCPMREYYPRPLLPVPSRAHAPHTPRAYHRKISRPCQSDIVLKEVHPFISEPMRSSLEEGAVRASLAHYRATGCRLVHNNHTIGCPSYKPSVVKKLAKEEDTKESRDEASESEEPVDPLSPENHQKLNLLLYSYSHKSPNVPDFCVNPWTVTMEMYGRHDISLGGFLEKYCFNSEYKCPSANCQVPMNMHVRRFVHEDVCITITCNTIGHSNVDKLKEDNKQVMFWSRCERCSGVARASRLSRSALALSLAQYVRLRCSAPRYRRARCCDHALNAHAHAFVSGLTTAYFRYSKISTYDIELPPEMISINYDTKQMRDALINQLNDLVLKGHETFSNLTEGDAEKDYQTFKQHMDQIHLALTSTSLQEQNSLAAVVRSLWSVSDRIITGEKMLRDAQDKWSTPPAKTNRPQLESNVEDKSDLEDSVEVGGSEISGSTYVFTADNAKDSDKEHTGEEDEEKGDKKTVKQILSQLLSNNQPSNQSGMIISTGFIPVVVMAGEIGSVIAATLASVTYQRSLRAQRQSVNQAEQEDNENINASGKEKTEAEKSKAAKCNDHIEVLLKDGLLCRVYYASQFHRLRHALLPPLARNPHITDHFVNHDNRQPPDDSRCSCYDSKDKPENKSVCEIEEGFVRSLAQCVPWAARGGKSGSTFCKTKDDRYVLKEMTKPEWQQFLEFAPHYFNYLTNCHKSKLPSLLARILGVFSVGGSGSGVLVMENVWYGCGGTRYDLKGSSRHRLAPDEGAGVLMDENLLLLRWERPLYVRQHTGAVLSACLQRDTAFLHLSSVMDYSLLLGLPDDRLVLGIIDYIRTFTWDKKLEHLVKKNLGSGQPTVVSPEQYKQRFLAACRKYFLQCPSHWDHLLPTVQA